MSKKNVYQELIGMEMKFKAQNFEANDFIKNGHLDKAINILKTCINSCNDDDIKRKATLAAIMTAESDVKMAVDGIKSEIKQAKVRLHLCQQALDLFDLASAFPFPDEVKLKLVKQLQLLDLERIIDKPDLIQHSLDQASLISTDYLSQFMRDSKQRFEGAMDLLSQKIKTVKLKCGANEKKYAHVLREAELMKQDMEAAAKLFFDEGRTNLQNFKENITNFKLQCKTAFDQHSKTGEFSKHRIMEPVTALVLNLLLSCVFGIWAIAASIAHKEWRLGFFNSGTTTTQKDMKEVDIAVAKATAIF